MGDSSCSGSTPFKSLVEHGAQDRSLHQDRISGATGHQSGFRSATPATSAQAQDAFGAFLTSNTPGSHNLHAHGPSIPNGFVGLTPPHMAADQHAHRFSPGPFPSASPILNTTTLGADPIPRQHHQVSNASLEASNWAQDFERLSRGAAGASARVSAFPNMQHPPHPPAGFAHSMMALPPGPSFFGSVGVPAVVGEQGATDNAAAIAEADFDLEMDRWMAAHGDGHIEDVDAIMEQLARELEQEKAAPPEVQSPHGLGGSAIPANVSAQDGLLGVEVSKEQLGPVTAALGRAAVVEGGVVSPNTDEVSLPANVTYRDHLPDISRLGLHEASEVTATEPTGQAQSEISEAARQILESVQHEQGDKWKNSRFLLLMRDFRDGNKDIINNEILETQGDGERAGEEITAAGN